MATKQIPEARELTETLRGLIRVGQYQQTKDRIARTNIDDSKNK